MLKKFSITILVIVFILIINDFGSAQNKDKNNPNEIINMIGQRLRNVFEIFGYPTSVYGYENGDVLMEYDDGKYGFKIKNKTVVLVIFFSEYTQKVRGISMGDDKTSVTNILGEPFKSSTSNDKKTIYLYYDFQEKDSYFTVGLDTDNKVKFLRVELK